MCIKKEGVSALSSGRPVVCSLAMSLLCSCLRGEEDGEMYKNEADYLLPGGEWDPSVSASVRERSSRRRGAARSRNSGRSGSNRGGSVGDDGAEDDSGSFYSPPEVPGATSIPRFQDFKLLKTVGRGAFGKVMLCVHRPTNVLYAMKVVPKAKIQTQKQTNQILTELNILKRIQHPFCVALKSTFQDENFLFYIFCFAAGGMLFYHLKQEGRFTELRARFYLGEIILALNYLHGFNIIFRDLKPENCMLSEQGHVILTDFGSAKSLDRRERANTLAGTPQYMAPEVLRGEPYSFSADWWSCGVLLYEMLTGKTPFNSADRGDLYKMVLRGDFRAPNYISPRARSLLYKLINKDPEFRLGCSSSASQDQAIVEIKEHSFFSHTPMDPDEEMLYSTEEAERERHRQALARARRSRERDTHNSGGSIVGAASNVLRSLSIRQRVSGSGTYQGTMCEWTWEDLESRRVTPPFKPQLRGPTDLRNFDPIITSVPATISDQTICSTELHIEGFDFSGYSTASNGGHGGGGEDGERGGEGGGGEESDGATGGAGGRQSNGTINRGEASETDVEEEQVEEGAASTDHKS